MMGEYYRIIKRLAKHNWEIAPHLEKLLLKGDPEAEFVVKCKAEALTQTERIWVNEYLQFGHFKQFSEDQRRAAYGVVLDVEYEKELKDQIKFCTPYEGTEAIFKNREIAEQRNEDLIDRPIGQRLPNSNIFRIGNHWGYYDRRIPLEFYDWLERCFKDKTSRIRIEPNGYYDHKPQDLLLEFLVIPPKWKWWKTLGQYLGDFNGSEYVLDGHNTADLEDYQDYHYKNVRKLQTIAKRREKDYLTMMVEELSEYNHPTDPNRKYVVGRMIHLDSNAVSGTSFRDAVLMHIDLAFNLYVDNDADVRMSQTLADGDKVQKATKRTHIIRVDNVPFETLFKFAVSFFRSKYLTNEWLTNEFNKE